MNKRLYVRVGLILLVLGAFAAYKYWDLSQFLSLENLKANQETLNTYYLNHSVKTALVFLLIYVLATALSLPGATLITLAGGAIFGVLVGTVLVSVASSIGATLAFLSSRFLLRFRAQ